VNSDNRFDDESRDGPFPLPTCNTVQNELREGEDFYFEGRFMVFTAAYLRRRGYCCKNDCRNCPYSKEVK
jgi:Family of unknown function (DUF5522)